MTSSATAAFVVTSETGDVQIHHASCPEQAALARAASDRPETEAVYRVDSKYTVLVKPVADRFFVLISKRETA